jgi:DNA-binding MarR family transcriptional regulator
LENRNSQIEIAFASPIDPFPRPGLVFILGTPGSRKTWLGLNLAVSAATASGWQGVPLRFASSLFISYDLAENSLRQFAHLTLLAHKATNDTQFFFSSQTDFNLHAIFSTASRTKAGFIVLDSPFGHQPFQDPSEVFSRTVSFPLLNYFAAKAHATLVILLHTRKRRTSIGNALLAAGAHHVMAVDAPFGQPLVHLRTTNAVPGIAPLSITARGPFTLYKLPRSNDFKPPHTLGNAGYQLLDFLNANGKSSTKELMQTISFAVPERVRNLIKDLVKDGYIRRSNFGHRGTPALYALTPAGSEILSSWHEGVA